MGTRVCMCLCVCVCVFDAHKHVLCHAFKSACCGVRWTRGTSHNSTCARLCAYLGAIVVGFVHFECVAIMEVVGVELSSTVRSTKVANIAAPAPFVDPVLSPASAAA